MMVVDASVWVGSLVAEDAHHVASLHWLSQQFADSGATLVAPSLLLPEVAGAVARRTGKLDLAQRILDGLLRFPELELIPLDEDLSLAAARLAARLCLRGADACYVAVAQVLGLPLVTWDAELQQRAGQVVPVLEPKL